VWLCVSHLSGRNKKSLFFHPQILTKSPWGWPFPPHCQFQVPNPRPQCESSSSSWPHAISNPHSRPQPSLYQLLMKHASLGYAHAKYLRFSLEAQFNISCARAIALSRMQKIVAPARGAHYKGGEARALQSPGSFRQRPAASSSPRVSTTRFAFSPGCRRAAVECPVSEASGRAPTAPSMRSFALAATSSPSALTPRRN
jgi:hypothetical protein